MSNWDHIGHSVRETLEQLADGWQEIWQKARGAITRFTPAKDDPRPPGRSITWGVLSAELRETGDEIEVTLEAPGMESTDFNVQVDGQVLYVSGKRSYSDERKQGHYHITERAYGSFQRAIQLPADVDDANAHASYQRGVLEVRIPKSREAHPRRITVAS